MKATLYCPVGFDEESLKLPAMILQSEGFKVYCKGLTAKELILKSKGKTANSWCVKLDGFSGVACDWKEIYKLLSQYGLLNV